MIRYILLLSLVAVILGCESKTEITAPDKLLPPTKSADAGSSGGDTKSKDNSGGEKEKFVP
ncbi:MAG: hypothetical protein ACK5OC_26870 [Pirellula sp.]|jgi:hypothetical protein